MMVQKTRLVGYAVQSNFLTFKTRQKKTRWSWRLTILKARKLWYKLFKETEEGALWGNLKEGLHVRYGPTQFNDFFGDLTKLRQTGTVREY